MALKRHILLDKMLYISFVLLILFAYFDSENIIGIKEIDNLVQNSDAVWAIYFRQIMPAIFMLWIGILAALALTWYLYSKDKSESLALFLTPAILIWTGFQDILYYIISPDVMTECMGCWADVILPVRIVSDLLGETCPTATALIISGSIGAVISYYTYKYLKKAKW